jgi:hypothetical protein
MGVDFSDAEADADADAGRRGPDRNGEYPRAQSSNPTDMDGLYCCSCEELDTISKMSQKERV